MKVRHHSGRTRTYAVVAGLLASTLALSACGAGGDGDGGKTTITFWAFGSEGQLIPNGDTLESWFQEKIDEFEAANPDIGVELAIRGSESNGTTLFVDSALAAGEPPDVYQDAIFRLGKYGIADQTLDLKPILTEEKLAQTNPDEIARTTIDGRTWGIITARELADPLLVNRALFTNIGQADLIPDETDRTWTISEFETALNAIKDGYGGDVYGLGLYGKTPSSDHGVFAFLAQFGAERLAKETECTAGVLDGEPATREGAAWLRSLVDAGLVLPGPGTLTDGDVGAKFIAGQVAVNPTGGWYDYSVAVNGLNDGSLTPEQMDPILVDYPYPDGGEPDSLATLGGSGYVAFKTGDEARQAASLKLIDFMSSPEVATDFALDITSGNGGGVPLINEPGAATSIADLFPADSAEAWMAGQMAERDLVQFGYLCGGFNDVRQAWAEARQAMWTGDVDEAIDAFITKADSIFDENN